MNDERDEILCHLGVSLSAEEEERVWSEVERGITAFHEREERQVTFAAARNSALKIKELVARLREVLGEEGAEEALFLASQQSRELNRHHSENSLNTERLTKELRLLTDSLDSLTRDDDPPVVLKIGGAEYPQPPNLLSGFRPKTSFNSGYERIYGDPDDPRNLPDNSKNALAQICMTIFVHFNDSLIVTTEFKPFHSFYRAVLSRALGRPLLVDEAGNDPLRVAVSRYKKYAGLYRNLANKIFGDE